MNIVDGFGINDNSGKEFVRAHNCDHSVFGNLKKCMGFWQSIGASEYVLKIIEHGYFLSFVALPPPMHAHNLPSALAHSRYVTQQVITLVAAGAVVPVTASDLIVISPLGVVPKKNGKLRLILDLRYLNMFLAENHFAFEDLRIVPTLFSRGDFMFTFDLKDGYHHISIAERHRRYLGFAWQFHGETKFFHFAALPFGLKTAPFVFTKVLRPLVAHWRSEGIRMFMFLDDGTCAAHSEAEARRVAAQIRKDLVMAGWTINIEKSCFTPRQCIEALGHVVDTVSNCVTVTPARVARLKELIHSVKSAQGPIPVRHLAKLTGSLSSMWLALGCIVRLQTRALHCLISSASMFSWQSLVTLSAEASKELEFWHTNFDHFHGQPIWCDSPRLLTLAWVDASDSGWGGFCLKSNAIIARGDWPWAELSKLKSSTLRELLAARYTLTSLSKHIKGQQVCLNTDNQNVVSILCKGSSKPNLHEQAVAIFNTCLRLKTRLFVQWIPRSLNVSADYLSRIIDHDDWQVSPRVFAVFNKKWGPFSVDRFASHLSTQLPVFNSKWWSPGCIGVDCFSQAWEEHNNWCVPPPSLLGQLYHFLCKVPCHATVAMPCWPSAPWWPLWMPKGQPCHIIFDMLYWSPAYADFYHVSMPKCLFGPKPPPFQFVFMAVCSKHSCSLH